MARPLFAAFWRGFIWQLAYVIFCAFLLDHHVLLKLFLSGISVWNAWILYNYLTNKKSRLRPYQFVIVPAAIFALSVLTKQWFY